MGGKSKIFALKRRIIGGTLAGLLLVFGGGCLALWLGSAFVLPAVLGIVTWLLVVIFTLYFLRDPEPNVPQAPNLVVAPAHGLVDCIEETTELEVLNGPCRRISIFLSVLDVHVQNAPIAGKILCVKHRPGRFLSALKAESAQYNESALIGIESHEVTGERLALRQIAGAIARRVDSWVNAGDTVSRGQRLGLIHYGSRCDLYLPLSYPILVRLGDKVVGGETVVAAHAVEQ